MVGVNEFQVDEVIELEALSVDPKVEENQKRQLAELRASRHETVSVLLGKLESAARSDELLMPVFIECAENEVTLGEICNVLRSVGAVSIADFYLNERKAMAKIKKINHVAIVVRDIEESLRFWRDQLGLKLDHVEDVPSQASMVAFIPVGEGEIELVQPTDMDTGLGKYLEKRGEGMHHLCIEVDEIDGMLDDLKAQGVQLIDEVARDLPGRRMAFIHPRAANGVLVELYEIVE